MFKTGNEESKKGGRKSARLLLKRLGSEEKVSKHFKNLVRLRDMKKSKKK